MPEISLTGILVVAAVAFGVPLGLGGDFHNGIVDDFEF